MFNFINKKKTKQSHDLQNITTFIHKVPTKTNK